MPPKKPDTTDKKEDIVTANTDNNSSEAVPQVDIESLSLSATQQQSSIPFRRISYDVLLNVIFPFITPYQQLQLLHSCKDPVANAFFPPGGFSAARSEKNIRSKFLDPMKALIKCNVLSAEAKQDETSERNGEVQQEPFTIFYWNYCRYCGTPFETKLSMANEVEEVCKCCIGDVEPLMLPRSMLLSCCLACARDNNRVTPTSVIALVKNLKRALLRIGTLKKEFSSKINPKAGFAVKVEATPGSQVEFNTVSDVRYFLAHTPEAVLNLIHAALEEIFTPLLSKAGQSTSPPASITKSQLEYEKSIKAKVSLGSEFSFVKRESTASALYRVGGKCPVTQHRLTIPHFTGENVNSMGESCFPIPNRWSQIQELKTATSSKTSSTSASCASTGGAYHDWGSPMGFQQLVALHQLLTSCLIRLGRWDGPSKVTHAWSTSSLSPEDYSFFQLPWDCLLGTAVSFYYPPAGVDENEDV